jgi:hypothetical protein
VVPRGGIPGKDDDWLWKFEKSFPCEALVFFIVVRSLCPETIGRFYRPLQEIGPASFGGSSWVGQADRI